MDLSESIKLMIKDRLSRWNSLTDSEKDLVKALMLPNILSTSPPLTERELTREALAIIGFGLLPELKGSLHNVIVPDLAPVIHFLEAIDLSFVKFRCKWTSHLVDEHSFCVEQFFATLMNTFRLIGLWGKTCGDNGSVENLWLLVKAGKLCCGIFYSLIFFDLHDLFEESTATWLAEFHMYLVGNYSALGDSDYAISLVEELRTAVCENISLYMEKAWDTFGIYLVSNEGEFGFVRSVWNLVVSATPRCERLTIAGIKFLTIIGLNCPFADGDLEMILQEIPTRYLMLRDDDIRLFEENYDEFVMSDIEGKGFDMRRIACELLKGICQNNKEKFPAKVFNLIKVYLDEFMRNQTENWKLMDCAIYLVLSLGIKNKGGALIDLNVLNETKIGDNVKAVLQLDINELPMLKASALKFVNAYMNLIPKSDGLELIPYFIKFLNSESNVVHSYAGSCIENLLLIKDDGGQFRYRSADIVPRVTELTTKLFDALEKKGSEENQYIMRCIMRVLGVADVSNEEVCSVIMMNLNNAFNKVCDNPKKPIFNYHLFESLSLLIQRACENNHGLAQILEGTIIPSFRKIFAINLAVFFPYAFQLLAQLRKLKNSEQHCLSEYMCTFDSFLLSSAIEPSACWIQSFIKNAPQELNQERLPKILSLLERLFAHPSSYEQGFYVLNAVMVNCEFAAFSNHMSPIWVRIFAGFDMGVRISNYAVLTIIFMSLFLVKHGSKALLDSVFAALQDNHKDKFLTFLRRMWIPFLKIINGRVYVKITLVASARLVYEYLSSLPDEAGEMGGAMFDSLVALLIEQEKEIVGTVPFEKMNGCGANSVYLHNASTKEKDPLEEITDLNCYLVSSLAASGPACKIIWDSVSADTQCHLTEKCALYSVSGMI